ncbi:MAG: DAK2 domain-containing protein [Eubacteriales bacterium]
MNTATIGGKEFTEMLCAGASRLAIYRQNVNDLNVFPIPDGDTGDNMMMTFASGAEAAKSAGEKLGDTAKAAARGMLLGARGNSGVILSRIFSGITKEFFELDEGGIYDFMRGMESGVAEAYDAVKTPVEGTILTVFKDAVTYAKSKNSSTVKEYFDDLLSEMARSLERTPELLPVLSEAGVVDSGGAGLLYIFEGMRDALLGKAPSDTYSTADFKRADDIDFSLFGADSELKYGYCTEFLLRLQNSKCDVSNFDLEAFVAYLQSVGESVVAFKDDSIVRVHVHTMHPGQILDHCQQYGEFLTMKIENMALQNSEALERGNNAQSVIEKKRQKATGIVSVCNGDGVKETFISLGVDAIVDGGQSMNPSAADFIEAFDKVNARRIFVFPNNGNVIMTAEQAASLYDKSEIVVIKTHTVGEGYAAISMMDTEGDTKSIKESAEEIVSGVVTGLVSHASRNADMNGVQVHEGDYIGFVGDEILSDGKDRNSAAKEMLSKLDTDEYGVMLVIVGEETKDEEADELYKELSAIYKNTEIIMINGGQPIYDYMIVLE